MTRPPDANRSVVLTRRWDQLGGRLSALTNATALAERLMLSCQFVWPRGPDTAVNDPAALFTESYIAAHELPESALEDAFPVPFRDYLAAPQELPAFIDVDLIFEALALEDESADLAAERFVRCWEAIGWNEAVRDLMSRSAEALAGSDVIGIHVRAGDIIDGDWRHIVGHEKYVPTPYFEHALTTLGAGGQQILVISDNAGYLARLRSQHPGVVTAAELIAGYRELPEIHQALVDILVLSRCERIVGPPYSAFSRLAALVGRRPFVRADELVSADDEPGFLLGRLTDRQRELDTDGEPAMRRLLARDIVWCLDVFIDELPPATVRALAASAAALDPDFAGAAARLARVAAVDGDRETAAAAAATARRLAASVTRHDDPRLEALATSLVVTCADIIETDPPLVARYRPTATLPPARRWLAAERSRCAELIARAERDLAEAQTMHPIWGKRDRILEALSALLATARWVADQAPLLRHQIARAVRTPPPRGAAAPRLAGLTAHRQEAMFDPLRRDLARIVQQIFIAVDRAQRRSAS